MKRSVTLFCALLISALSLAQNRFTISGYIEDAGSGEKLIAANILDLKSGSGAISNTYGFFSLTLPADSVTLTFSYIAPSCCARIPRCPSGWSRPFNWKRWR